MDGCGSDLFREWTQNLYEYSRLNPIVFFDPQGTFASLVTLAAAGGACIALGSSLCQWVWVHYNGYLIDVGGGWELPLGHAEVVSVDPSNGYTEYYEFGRYRVARI